MSARCYPQTLLACLLVAWNPSIGFAQISLAAQKAHSLIQRDAKVILFFAHPSATFESVQLDKHQNLKSGFALTYTFRWQSKISDKSHHSVLTFYCDDRGRVSSIDPQSASSLMKPFFGANVTTSLIRRELEKDPDFKKNPVLMKLADRNAKEILETYLKQDVGEIAHIVKSLMGNAEAVSVTTRKPAIVNDPEVVELLQKSQSMNAEERAYWLKMLPNLTDDQRQQLIAILVHEREQLAAIDRKYADQIAAIGTLETAKSEIERGNFQEAVKTLSEILQAAPDNVEILSLRAHCWGRLKRYQLELADRKQALSLQPNSWMALNNLAWLYATCPDASVRDGQQAETLAEKACRATGNTNGFCMDTLAAALAENGDFERAAQIQQTVIALPSVKKEWSPKAQAEALQRLEDFRSGKPYRE